MYIFIEYYMRAHALESRQGWHRGLVTALEGIRHQVLCWFYCQGAPIGALHVYKFPQLNHKRCISNNKINNKKNIKIVLSTLRSLAIGETMMIINFKHVRSEFYNVRVAWTTLIPKTEIYTQIDKFCAGEIWEPVPTIPLTCCHHVPHRSLTSSQIDPP